MTSFQNDNYSAATVAPFVKDTIKDVQCVSFVVPSNPAPFVSGADDVAANGPVGARLQQFWEGWANLGACPREVQILKEGYTLPLCSKAKIDRNSCGRKRLCKCNQAGAPGRCIACISRQKSGGTSKTSNLSGLLQQVVFSSKTKPKMEANSKP